MKRKKVRIFSLMSGDKVMFKNGKKVYTVDWINPILHKFYIKDEAGKERILYATDSCTIMKIIVA